MTVHIASEAEINTVYDIRKKVFVEEQLVPIDIEIDDLEQDAFHFICYYEGNAVGASRLRLEDSYGKLERICVLQAYRGLSLGKQIIKKMEKHIQKMGYPTAKLSAQTHAISFYQSLGYHIISDEYMDAGIPHKTMMKSLNDQT
ncbi:MAG TPA: GNAT family N-acetyltransferase [Pseudogracilibacillus sp.]|nr:GNAT family N-acetyltransferase [Pseudogracilibacillus sp.]